MKGISCVTCGSANAPQFISLGNKMICKGCASKKDKETKKKVGEIRNSLPRIFTRAICLTHNCGTYNLTYMSRAHEMEDCDIYFEQTLGVMEPKTFGGLNGDISRKVFLGKVNEFVRLNQNAKNYVKFKAIERQIALSKSSNIKVSFEDRKFYAKHFQKFKRVTS